MYREWVAGMPCLLSGVNCIGVVCAHHVKTRGAGGRDEANLLPLCVQHHQEIHSLGRTTFERRYQMNLDSEAQSLFERTGTDG